jgi:cob(I)alamin adenosyltransferase
MVSFVLLWRSVREAVEDDCRTPQRRADRKALEADVDRKLAEPKERETL